MLSDAMTLVIQVLNFIFIWGMFPPVNIAMSSSHSKFGLPCFNLAFAMELENCEKQNYGINKGYWPCLSRGCKVSARLWGEEDDGRNLRDYLGYQLVSIW